MVTLILFIADSNARRAKTEAIISIIIYLFALLKKKKDEMIELLIMAKRPQETTRLIREATSAFYLRITFSLCENNRYFRIFKIYYVLVLLEITN